MKCPACKSTNGVETFNDGVLFYTCGDCETAYPHGTDGTRFYAQSKRFADRHNRSQESEAS